MSTKFSLTLGLALLLAGTAPVLAQNSKAAGTHASSPAGLLATNTPAPTPTSMDAIAARANALTTNMAQALGLNPAQTEKVRAINMSSVRTVEAARVRYRQEPATLRAHISDIGLARLEQLKEVLSPAQFTRYQQKREEKMGIPTVQGTQGTPPPGLGGSGRGEDN